MSITRVENEELLHRRHRSVSFHARWYSAKTSRRLVYAGMDWVDPQLAKRSMQLMAEQVMPRVNAAIGASKASAAE